MRLYEVSGIFRGKQVSTKVFAADEEHARQRVMKEFASGTTDDDDEVYNFWKYCTNCDEVIFLTMPEMPKEKS